MAEKCDEYKKIFSEHKELNQLMNESAHKLLNEIMECCNKIESVLEREPYEFNVDMKRRVIRGWRKMLEADILHRNDRGFLVFRTTIDMIRTHAMEELTCLKK